MSYTQEILKAKTMGSLERNAYWRGYARGVRRAHFGERFGTDKEHRLYLAAVRSEDDERRELGTGYRDGLAAMRKGGKGA
jgi:hypothetical protein